MEGTIINKVTNDDDVNGLPLFLISKVGSFQFRSSGRIGKFLSLS